MKRPPKFGEATKHRAIALLKQGRPQREVLRLLKKEGHKAPSVGTLSTWSKELQAGRGEASTVATVEEVPPSTVAGPVASPPPVATTAPTDPRERMRELLEEQANVLVDAARKALADGNQAGVAAAARALSAASKELRAMTPPPAEAEPEGVFVTHQVMDECGRRGANKLREMMARAMAERETWPKCSHCGQPVKPSGESK